MFLFANNQNFRNNGEFGAVLAFEDGRHFDYTLPSIPFQDVYGSGLQPFSSPALGPVDQKIIPGDTPPIAILPAVNENPTVLTEPTTPGTVYTPPIYATAPDAVKQAPIRTFDRKRREIVYVQAPADAVKQAPEEKPAESDGLIFGIEPKYLLIGGAAVAALFMFASAGGGSTKEK